MKIRLVEGEELPNPSFSIRVVEYDEEIVVLSLGDEIEIELTIDDWSVGRGVLVPVKGREYVFQSGGKSVEEVTPPPPMLARPRSSDNQRVVRPSLSSRPLSSPGKRDNNKEVFFVFRFSPVLNWVELSIELEEGMPDTEYSDRLAFRYTTSNENSIMMTSVDSFVDQEIAQVIIEDDDNELSQVRLFSHTSKQFAAQGEGEVDGIFSFRVTELTFPQSDQEVNCKACMLQR